MVRILKPYVLNRKYDKYNSFFVPCHKHFLHLNFSFQRFNWRFSQMSRLRLVWQPDAKSIFVQFNEMRFLVNFSGWQKHHRRNVCIAWGYFRLNFSFLTIETTLIRFVSECQQFTNQRTKPSILLISEKFAFHLYHWLNSKIHILFSAFIDLSLRGIFCIYLILYRQKSNGIILKKPSYINGMKQPKFTKEKFPQKWFHTQKTTTTTTNLFAECATLWKAGLVITDFNFNWANQMLLLNSSFIIQYSLNACTLIGACNWFFFVEIYSANWNIKL